METIIVQDITYIVITREDGSKLTFEANESNPEYAALIASREDENNG